MTDTPQPPQTQQLPGRESEMTPAPAFMPRYPGSGRLLNKVALITGGDSGIGRSVAVHFAREGADVAIAYLNEHEDARETQAVIEAEGRRAVLIPGDVGDERYCQSAVAMTMQAFGGIDILVNNAAEQHVVDHLEDLPAEQLERTFRTNVFGYFFMAKAALKVMKDGSCIINTTSVTAFKGSPQLLDYSATRGAVLAFTRSLSSQLAERNIRVNAVAPGPIWTPLIPASFDAEKTAAHGQSSKMGRAGQPNEVAPAYVFLACDDASYITGQTIHPNGGEVVNA